MKINLIKKYFLFFCLLLCLNFLYPSFCQAMVPGALVYRTSSNGKMFGYSGDALVESKKGIMKDIYPGHVGIYVGQENGVDYVVEALAGGVVMTPADKFVNEAEGEKYLGAKIPKNLTAAQQAKVVKIARSLATKELAYDFDYKTQKGPYSGQWTCVGLVEKIYESANISNPHNLEALEYDNDYYAIDITDDGFDNYSIINDEGDCFSTDYEFSKIARRKNLLLPAPELIGYDVGFEIAGERFVFLPYTQFLQPTLIDTPTDIQMSSSFSGEEVRGSYSAGALAARWSLINNPISSVKIIVQKTNDLLLSLKDKIFGADTDIADSIVFNDLVEEFSPELAVAVKARAIINKADKKSSTSEKEKTSLQKLSEQAYANKSKKITAKVAKNSELITKSAVKNNEKAAQTTKIEAKKEVKTEVEENDNNASSTLTLATTYYAPTVSTPNNFNQNNNASSGGSGSGGGGGSSYSSSQVTDNYPKIATIDKIYATDDSDWIELYNPTDHDFDLAAAGYRIEWAKSAKDPEPIMVIGNEDYGYYPGGTVIKAHGYYLIVKDTAADYYLSKADAVATRERFSWKGSGYTLFLGTAAISSITDEDIVEAVGFGTEATYFQGNGPAPEIKDYYILARIADSGNNDTDFQLIKSDNPEIDWLALERSDQGSANENPDSLVENEEDVSDEDGDDVSDEGEDNIFDEDEDNVLDNGDEVATSSEEFIEDAPIFINKIYATGNNDWIELYNPSDHDFDLAAAGYRLSKAKTSEYPNILMRIGKPEDGYYPGGTVIKARSTYLIVRDEASGFYQIKADAIATNTDFTWGDSGYTIYLGKGAISSSTDPDILEIVGFGPEASYWQGTGPAPAITDNYILSRVATSSDNRLDFELIESDDPDIDWPSTEVEEPIFNGVYTFYPSDYDLLPQVEPIESADLKYLWHFDECSGEQINSAVGSSTTIFSSDWAGGKFDCAQEAGLIQKKISSFLEEPVDINNFSLSFWFKTNQEYPRLSLTLSNSEDENINLTLEKGLMQFAGLPNPDWRYYTEFPFDHVWRQAMLVVNRQEGYWAFYVDGEEKMYINSYKIFPLMDKLEIGGTNGLFVIDEVAIWEKALSPDEVYLVRNIEEPFAPITFRSLQSAAVLKHFWNFNEGVGTSTADLIGEADLIIDKDAWRSLDLENSVLVNKWGKDVLVEFPVLESPDLSLTFKWRSTDVSCGDRNRISLRNKEVDRILTAIPGQYVSGYNFAGKYNFIGYTDCLKTPKDTEWHDIAIVYDSYRSLLHLYLDGQATEEHSYLWPVNRPLADSLEIVLENGVVEIDDLGVWEGALSAKQIKVISANN